MNGTLYQLGQQMLQSFQKLNPAEQEATRKEMYEAVTGLPYRPDFEAKRDSK
jgi:hypothetical protein